MDQISFYDMLVSMIEFQNRLNSIIDENWIEAQHPWEHAILVECAELMDMAGYKWWKTNDPPSLQQMQYEVVDVWHFLLSELIEDSEDIHAEDLAIGIQEEMGFLGILDLTETHKIDVVRAAHAMGSLPTLDAFAHLLVSVDMDWFDLYRLYMQKNVLNLFRQEMGYNDPERTYIKSWFGKEDNQVLEELVESGVAPEDLFGELKKKYDEVIDGSAELGFTV